MRTLLLISLLLGAPAWADVVAPGGKVIDCFCTDSQGERVDLGETICLFVDGRAFLARCEMSLNNPMWRETGEGCVSSKVIDRLQTLQQSTLSDVPAPRI